MVSRARKTTALSERLTVGYVRVSTEDQATNGVSLDDQEARIAAYAQALGVTLDRIVRDAGFSAKTLRRPGIGEVLQGVKNGEIGRVIVLKLDRLTRSVRDLGELMEAFAKADAALVSVCDSLDTKSASGRLVVNIMASVAQWEREAISERTTDALAQKRATGQAYGPTPFGYAREGKALMPIPAEQELLDAAIRMDRDGKSFRAIAQMLESSGVKPHRGTMWYPASVRKMVRSKHASERIVN